MEGTFNLFTSYLCTNNMTLKNHHGSRKYHGTNTAITHITNEINTQYENNAITATMATAALTQSIIQS